VSSRIIQPISRAIPRHPLALVADIGGTNARFALTDPRRASPALLHPATLPCAEFASLQQAIEHYLTTVTARPQSAAIAVASPVAGDEIRLTNRAWSFSREELRERLDLSSLHTLNDFGAIAWSLPALDRADSETLHGPAAAALRGPVTVIGPGTGLGIALLTGGPETGWQIVETEGGHASFAPQGDEEQMIARWIGARFGRVSNERLLSGAGLSRIDGALAAGGNLALALDERAPLRDPATIVAAALDGHDVTARRALARFCAVLGSVTGDAALLHGARTVMIGGGIVPRFVPFLRSSAFRERFLAKGRMAALLESVTIRVITHEAPGLLGAAMFIRSAAGKTA